MVIYATELYIYTWYTSDLSVRTDIVFVWGLDRHVISRVNVSKLTVTISKNQTGTDKTYINNTQNGTSACCIAPFSFSCTLTSKSKLNECL